MSCKKNDGIKIPAFINQTVGDYLASISETLSVLSESNRINCKVTCFRCLECTENVIYDGSIKLPSFYSLLEFDALSVFMSAGSIEFCFSVVV